MSSSSRAASLRRKDELVALGQLALAAPHLVAEVLALGGEELVPALAVDRQRGAGLGEQHGGARCAAQPSAPPSRSPTSRSARQRRSESTPRRPRPPARGRRRRTPGRAGRPRRGRRTAAPAAGACGSGRAAAAPTTAPPASRPATSRSSRPAPKWRHHTCAHSRGGEDVAGGLRQAVQSSPETRARPADRLQAVEALERQLLHAFTIGRLGSGRNTRSGHRTAFPHR